MVCFNYKERKTVNIPIEFIDKINLLKKSIWVSFK
jgi:hypothetical protein